MRADIGGELSDGMRGYAECWAWWPVWSTCDAIPMPCRQMPAHEVHGPDGHRYDNGLRSSEVVPVVQFGRTFTVTHSSDWDLSDD